MHLVTTVPDGYEFTKPKNEKNQLYPLLGSFQGKNFNPVNWNILLLVLEAKHVYVNQHCTGRSVPRRHAQHLAHNGKSLPCLLVLSSVKGACVGMVSIRQLLVRRY